VLKANEEDLNEKIYMKKMEGAPINSKRKALLISDDDEDGEEVSPSKTSEVTPREIPSSPIAKGKAKKPKDPLESIEVETMNIDEIIVPEKKPFK
jgi:hypothetical protein